MKRFLVPLLLAVAFSSPADAAKNGNKQTYFRVGNTADASATLGGGVVLMGGSTDVDAAFQWMCQRAPGGDFLVVRATGTDAYNPYVQALCPGANSVATVIVDSIAAANDPVNVAYVQNAEMIWIAGGDASVVGYGNVYFLAAPGPVEVCQPRTPLTYRNVAVHRITVGDTFSLTRWRGRGGVDYAVTAEGGVLTSIQSGGSPY